MDFSKATAVGITQGELAKAVGVSRVTINLWLNGKMKPHRYNAGNIAERLALINAAIERGFIAKPTSKRGPRHDLIAWAIKQVELQNQEESTA